MLEVPSEEDRHDLTAPPGLEITWLSRTGSPGQAALAAATALPAPGHHFHGWVVGEQHLPSSLRRHWVRTGVPKENVMFCGYWRSTTAH